MSLEYWWTAVIAFGIVHNLKVQLRKRILCIWGSFLCLNKFNKLAVDLAFIASHCRETFKYVTLHPRNTCQAKIYKPQPQILEPPPKLVPQNSKDEFFWDKLFCSRTFLTYYTDIIHKVFCYFFSYFSYFHFDKQTAKSWQMIIHAFIQISYFYFHNFLYWGTHIFAENELICRNWSDQNAF